MKKSTCLVRRRPAGRPVLLSVLLFAAVASCRFQQGEPTARLEVAFTRPGVVEVRNTTQAGTVEVYDEAGRLVGRAQAFGRPAAEVRFPWRPGVVYRVVPEVGPSTTAVAPEAMPEFVVRLHAPLGQTPHECTFAKPYAGQQRREVSVPAEPGETVDVMLEIEKLTDGEPLALEVSSRIDRADAGGLSMDPLIAEKRASLKREFEKRFWTSRVRLGDRLPGKPLVITLRAGRVALSLDLRFVSRQLDEKGLSIVRWRLPTEANGAYERGRVADRLSMPSVVWARVASWLGVRTEAPSFYDPFTYQTLWIRNRTAQPVSLLLASEVLDPGTREPVDFFAAPELESTGGTGRVTGYGHIGPYQTQPCVLPVYLRPDTPAGTYVRRVEIRPLGSDKTLMVLEAPLGVVRSNFLFSGWVLGAAVVSLAWLLATLSFYRRMVKSLGIRLLVLLALLGSLQFCLQFLGGLISMVFYALLGPLNCLVGGLLTEVMTYLLVTSVLFLVPRVGAMTLAGIVSYVMGGILFGSFGLADVLYMGSSIAFCELFLVSFGVTRIRAGGAKPPNVAAMMLALGLADAAGAFTSLALQAVFYRLFFAGWYIFLQVVVTGFLYTALGVYLGKPLGMSLRKVHA